MKILFYCEATKSTGIGHLARCNQDVEGKG